MYNLITAMPVITEIKPQKNKKRVNIYLDGKFGFGLDLETLVKKSLKVGKVLDQDEIEKIVKEGELQKTYDKILRFAAIRPRSEKEFHLWLKKHKVHESLHRELLGKLKRLNFLDDESFAQWWIEQRQNFRPKSIKILKLELKMKGIDKETISNVLGSVDINELDIARNTLVKYERKWKGLNGFDRKKKIYTILAGKGFDGGLIRNILESYDAD